MDIASKVMFRNFTKAEAWMTDAKEIADGICSARTLVPDKCIDVPVRIVNVLEVPISLKAGFVVSELENVEVVEQDNGAANSTDLDYLNAMLHDVDISVPEEIREVLKRLVHRYHHIFSKSEYDLGRAKYVQHRIKTGDAKPFRQTLGRQPDKYLEVIHHQVDLMREQGLIEPAQSDWASNVVLAKKKDDSLRFCVDYRRLNSRTIKDTYPLPLIGSCLMRSVFLIGSALSTFVQDIIKLFWHLKTPTKRHF